MLNAYAVDAITIIRWAGNDQWGEPAASTSLSVRGYVDYKSRLVRDGKGEQVVSGALVYLGTAVEVTGILGRQLSLEDRLILPGETRERAIIEIRRPKALTNLHLEVYVA
jgi:hypothetical protein